MTDPQPRTPAHAASRTPAARDLRLVVPTLAVFVATAATVALRPAVAAALAVVLLAAGAVAAAWSTGAGGRARTDRVALGVVALACAVGAVAAGAQAARTYALAAHPLVELVLSLIHI